MNDSKRFETDALPERVRQLLKLPELEMEVMHVNHWVLDRVVADKYRVGRVFIAGDAAHRRPPASGLGLNTGIEDAQNIAWKLAFVLQQKADASLLDTYESERRPIGIRNSDWAFFSFSNMNVLSAGVGAIPGAQELNQQRFAQLFEDSERGRSALHHLRRVLQTQNIEYSAHDIELGFAYSDGVLVSDGTTAPVPDPEGQIYSPTTRPGHRLPHAWLVQDGETVSTHDLIKAAGAADFVLLTDEDGHVWVQAAETLTRDTNVKLSTAQIRARDVSKPKGLYLDHQDAWAELKGVESGGAVLVRPDNFVAWRSQRLGDHPGEELRRALAALMRQDLQPQTSQPCAIEAAAADVKLEDTQTEHSDDESSTTDFSSSSIATPVNEFFESQSQGPVAGTADEKDTGSFVVAVVDELTAPLSGNVGVDGDHV